MTGARVGIQSIAHYAPSNFVTAAEIAEASGIPEDVIRDKFGLEGKHIAAPDEHVTDMCVSAGAEIVEQYGADRIDAVVYFGSHWKDYSVWQAAPKVQHALGISGFSLEAINVSAGAPVACKVVKDLLVADENLRAVLMVGASRESHLVDYTKGGSRFMFNFGDGAVASIVERDAQANLILGSSIITDGSFSHHVMVPGGGSVHPVSIDTVHQGMHSLEVKDGEEMRRRLDPITLKSFLTVTTEALERSGRQVSNIDLLIPIHTKRSLYEAILKELGLSAGQGIYLDHHGHMSAVDPLFGLSIALDEGRLKDGDTVVLLAAGTGYTWAASVVEWGPRAVP